LATTLDIRHWRNAQRAELVARRIAVPAAQHRDWSRVITELLLQEFPQLRALTVGAYWPFKAEFDPRPAMRRLRRCGARLALPVVVQKNAPMQFREWWPGAPMGKGVLDLPIPVGTALLAPQALLIPLLGFDAKGYRLGLGGGYFDRTLATLSPQPLKIGVGFELSRIATIHPLAHDVAMDVIVTQTGVHRPGDVDTEGDEGAATAPDCERRAYASPVCYAHEFEPGTLDDG
jgi:5,10-methenyltetrahydrofolate synthetase